MIRNLKTVLLIIIFSFLLTGCGDKSDNSINASVPVQSDAGNDSDAKNQSEKENTTKENKNSSDVSSTNSETVLGEKTEEKKVEEKEDEPKEEIPVINNSAQKYSSLSTWAAYWDYKDAVSEINALGDALDTVVCFEALYGSDGRSLVHPEGCDELLNTLKSSYAGKKTIYLSYTNDYQNADGSYTQKSLDVLRAVFSSNTAMEAYAKDMVADAKRSGVDGVELDYENMRKDESLFSGYAEFVRILYNECTNNDLSLRVATEYQTGIKCSLVDGPEYVVMCYNLYGYGTEPGPKADMAYLDACYQNFSYLNHVSFAFSLGGFKWNNGNVTALTENEALSLLSASGATLSYEPSGGANFAFNEADGSVSTVYYADSNTVGAWKNYMVGKGAKSFALWRLGGNNLDSLKGMR